MLTAWIIIAILVVCFGGVLIFGAPYLPTLEAQIEMALDLAEIGPGKTLLELGSGDGRVAKAAAKRGCRVIGYELNPLLFIVSKIVTWRYRKLVNIRLDDFLRADWPPADAIFVFGLKRIMPKLDKKIMAEVNEPVRLVSFAFQVPDKKPKAKKGGVFLYVYH